MWHPYRDDIEYYDERARGLLASAWDGTPSALLVFGDEPLTEEGARVVLAREHGCEDWRALGHHIRRSRPFARAYQAIETQNPGELQAILERDPELAKAKGTNDNDLLGMATAKCDERLVNVLLRAGADVGQANVHGWTALHQAAYLNLPHLVRILLDAGAPVDVSARGDGGTPLVVALHWGHIEVAELLAAQGIHPANLRVAAGLGDLGLAVEPGAHRQFYRPHSGFPRWWPTDDPQEVVDEALSWAARNDRVEVFEPLLKRGANIDADVYRGTALTVAAARGWPNATRRLLELGADPNRRGTFGGPGHGEGITALHIAAQYGQAETISVLLEFGADRTVRDTLFDSTPAGWADHCGASGVRDLLGAD